MKRGLFYFQCVALACAALLSLAGCDKTEKDGDTMTESSGQWVDLGLPSGLLWASRNIGASSPTDYGNYYAWGETQPNGWYGWEAYIYGNDYNQLTKYCSKPSYGLNGFTDGLTTLQPVDDAATANWGGGARMPTDSEWQELMTNTTHQWVTVDGVNGQCFTGPNGNSIFLPASGVRSKNELDGVGGGGYYWSSSLYTGLPRRAWYFNFDSGRMLYLPHQDRYLGCSVRAVRQN